MKILLTSIIDLKNSQHNRPHEFVKHLSKRHEITVLSIKDWWKAEQIQHGKHSDDIGRYLTNVDYHYLSMKRINPSLQEILYLNKMDELVKNNYDVHLNYNSLLIGNQFSKRIRTLFDLADDLVAMIKTSPQLPNVLRSYAAYFGNFLLMDTIKSANRVSVTTPALTKSYYIPEEKLTVIPNGVDTSLFMDRGDAKKDLGFDGFIVGYVGVLREWLDFDTVFSALKLLPKEIRLMVVGREGYYSETVELAKKYGVQERVYFTGGIPYSKVPDYISAMDACLIPFKKNAISKNALPLKMFEYMACSRPVISVDIAGVQRAVGDLVLYASNSEELVGRVLDLYEDNGLRKKLGANGRAFVESNYDWAKIVDKLEQNLMLT